MELNATGFMLQTMFFLVNHNATDLMDTVFNEVTPHPIDPNETRCFGSYGCFPIGYPWTSEQRAHSVFPFGPSILDVKFNAFTRKHRKVPKLLDINDPYTIVDAGVSPSHPIYFVTHGFLEFSGAPWIKKMREELLINNKHATVIAIDWKGGSSPPYYQAVSNIRLVGAIVAHMIFTIYEELKLRNLDNVHLIGHSLGAHMSGYAGYYLQRDFELKLGRITGMDPAGPYFSGTEQMVRLDFSDAKYVDIIHSDASLLVERGFGIRQSIGHVDFYPNGGDNQPKCSNSVNVACDHAHSIELFTESINSKCKFMSITCENYESFKRGLCNRCNRNNNYCIRFGFNSFSSYKSIFSKGYANPGFLTSISTYLMTSDKEPFCRVHYKVFVKVASNDESRMHGGEVGFIYLKLKSSHGDGQKFLLNQQSIHFAPGKNFTFLAIGDEIEDIKSVVVDYKHKSTANPLTWRVFTPKIYLEYILIQSMEQSDSVELKLCPSHESPISSGEGLLFKGDSCEYQMRKETIEKIN
ncbi:pancreatic lipase-related protein 2-like [Chironomus tepperi]|uniref:pancreatic lipase-related protein 2-like n=1 Tax=Chironomus tepperi TaxID=113505 RepID=UPI00391EF737